CALVLEFVLAQRTGGEDAPPHPPLPELLPRLRAGRHGCAVGAGRRLPPRRRPDEGRPRRRGLRRAASRARPRVRSGRGPLERARVKLRALAIVAAAVLAGCGGDPGHGGTARLWITSDRGAHVLLTATVPAGLTAMQALSRKAKIETRYGGHFVQSI